MNREFDGTSERGDLREALSRAIANAKETLTTDIIEWTLVRVHGLDGGFVLREDLTAVITAAVPQTAGSIEEALFEVTDNSNLRPFIVKVLGRDRIDHARRIVSKEEIARVHVQGKIVKATAEYNPDWKFHVDPRSLDFFEIAIEVCDASMVYVEGHLDEIGGSMLPNCHWCPWASKLVREIV